MSRFKIRLDLVNGRRNGTRWHSDDVMNIKRVLVPVIL